MEAVQQKHLTSDERDKKILEEGGGGGQRNTCI